MVNHLRRSKGVRIALARQEVVRLRNLAAWQRGEYAGAYRRQASHPIYAGQDIVCENRAAEAGRLANANDAQADVLAAKIDAGNI